MSRYPDQSTTLMKLTTKHFTAIIHTYFGSHTEAWHIQVMLTHLSSGVMAIEMAVPVCLYKQNPNYTYIHICVSKASKVHSIQLILHECFYGDKEEKECLLLFLSQKLFLWLA